MFYRVCLSGFKPVVPRACKQVALLTHPGAASQNYAYCGAWSLEQIGGPSGCLEPQGCQYSPLIHTQGSGCSQKCQSQYAGEVGSVQE